MQDSRWEDSVCGKGCFLGQENEMGYLAMPVKKGKGQGNLS